jgi:hypothetical protein
MSKQLIDRKEQGRMISEMNGSVNRISDTSYTSCTSFLIISKDWLISQNRGLVKV